jgi:hypothetical protein
MGANAVATASSAGIQHDPTVGRARAYFFRTSRGQAFFSFSTFGAAFTLM